MMGGWRQRNPARLDRSRPTVSFITITMNRGALLERTMQSVAAQTIPNVEYIVVDGGSSDGTVELLQRYDDAVAWWVSEPDQGTSDASNKALQQVSGDFVVLLPCDDIIEPEYAEKLIAAHRRHPEFGYFYGYTRWIDHANREHFTAHDPVNFFMGVKRDIFLRFLPFNTSMHVANDYEFLLRMQCAGVTGGPFNGLMTVRNDGASKQYWVRSYYECMLAEMAHRKEYVRAPLRFVFRCTKRLGRALLEKCCGERAGRVCRQWINAHIIDVHR